MENKAKLKNIAIIAVIIVIAIIIFFYQTKKVGFHEDEVYTITSAVNQYNGLMTAYADKDTHTKMWEKYIFDDNFFTEIKNAINYAQHAGDYNDEMGEIDRNLKPIWRTNEDVKNYVSLSQDNYLNLKSIYCNQLKDTHPPFYYTLVHFSAILFAGEFTKYSAFIVNIVAFIISCFVLKRILKLLNKENLIIPTLIFYGLSMGTITMVIYQRMYMVLTLFILLYFYYTIQLYKNKFELIKKFSIKLGVVTVLGFLTQYYFAIYAFLILAIIVVRMIKDKEYKNIAKYLGLHVVYSVIGILIFIPCVHHLLSSERGISNLSNTDYINHLIKYIQYLAYAFTANNDIKFMSGLILIIVGAIVYLIKNKKDVFVILLTFIPSVVYFLLTVKLTSYQEFRYIMPVIPFVVLTIMIILDNVLNFEYKNIVLILLSILLITPGFLYSSPKFLFEEYADSLNIAEENKDKPFVYIYDNIFNHIQSIPEMMIYKKSIVINYNKDELQYVINSNELESENSYILCIKTYMDNDKIIEEIKQNTDFKNIEQIYFGPKASSEIISNNLYLVTK